MSEQSGPDPLFNQSLEKGLDVLCAFNAERRTMTLGEVAQAAGTTKSSAQRMIYTLEQLGYVRKHARTRRYQLTPKVMRVGFNYLAGNMLVEIATPFLSELARVTGETCNLTEPDGTEMVYIANFVSAKRMPIHMHIGSHIPMYCTASGRAYLSGLPEDEARQLLEDSHRVQHTPYTRTDVDQIMEVVRMAKRQGYATNREELFLGDLTLSAPILSVTGRSIGAIHVVAPTIRWTEPEAVQRLSPAMLHCARAVSTAARALD